MPPNVQITFKQLLPDFKNTDFVENRLKEYLQSFIYSLFSRQFQVNQ